MDVQYLGFSAAAYFNAAAPIGERLQVFELFSGVSSIHKAAVRAGFARTTFDKEANACEDILTVEGFQIQGPHACGATAVEAL